MSTTIPRKMARRLVRTLPPVRRREEHIARLQRRHRAEIVTLRAQHAAALEEALAETRRQVRAEPSWYLHMQVQRRLYGGAASVAPRLPIRTVPPKLSNYRLAASHGVRIPEVYAVWGRVDDVDLSGLPETFVLKSGSGSSGHGVFPVRRTAQGFALVDGQREFSPGGLVDALRDLVARRRISGPYFAESLLSDDTGGRLPVDVKVFCFYGQVSHVLLRDMPVHADWTRARRRYVRPDGTDLGAAVLREQDPSIPLPTRFGEVVRTAADLSLAVPLPFVRVDLYDATDGVVFGEITLLPGGGQPYAPNYDRWLGEQFEQAQLRLWQDLSAGRPYAVVHGPHPVPDLSVRRLPARPAEVTAHRAGRPAARAARVAAVGH